jgi:molybdopterin-guanine dinucleotide biosynthesis protein B
MRSIISIVGKSGSGKTTLLEKMIPELKRRGYRIGVVKHSHHHIDTAAKDTARFNESGAEFSAINSLDDLAIFRKIDHYFEPQEIASYIQWDYDLIITEGFKSSGYLRIEVHRKELGQDLVSKPEQLLAVVTDEPLDVKVPQFAADELSKIADFVEGLIIKARVKNDVDILVNGKQVKVSPSLAELVARSLIAAVPRPEDAEEIRSIHVSLRRQP